MVKCQVTRHLNGAVKCFIIQEDDDIIVINMDRVSIVAFEVTEDHVERPYSIDVHTDNGSPRFFFKSHENFREVRDFITSELTRP